MVKEIEASHTIFAAREENLPGSGRRSVVIANHKPATDSELPWAPGRPMKLLDSLKEKPVNDTDEIDLAILATIQAEGRIPISKLAEAVSLSETPCARRLKRLETDGYISGYHAQIDRERVGFGVLAFVQLSVSIHTDEATKSFEDAILGCDEVLSCHNVTGRADFLLQVVARNLTEYGQFIDRVLRKLPEIKSIESSLCLREMKTGSKLPVAGLLTPNQTHR